MQIELFENEVGKFMIFPNDAIAQHLKRGDLWEPHFKAVLDAMVRPGATVFDAGSNFGYNAVMMCKHIGPQGILYGVEPQRLIFQQLCGNLILNNCHNAYVYNTALSATEGELVFLDEVDYDAPWVNIGDVSIRGKNISNEAVHTWSLDTNFGAMQTLDFIKMDIQGAELYALKGGQTLIKQHEPDLFIEIEPHQLAKFKVDALDLVDYLRYLGYSIFRIETDYPCDHICTINNLEGIERLREKQHLTQI